MSGGVSTRGAPLLRCPVPSSRPAARTSARRPARLLLVDDLSYVREALAELERRGADLLLTDLYMPEMTGWDLVRAVRARGVTSTRGLPLCVGLYSAVLSGFSREQLTRAQVDFAVTKLSDPDSVLDAVERALAWSEVE